MAAAKANQKLNIEKNPKEVKDMSVENTITTEYGKHRYGSMILPNGNYYSLDDRITGLNNNVLLIGTSGTSKTRSCVIPNLLEYVGSYVVLDAKGRLYKEYGDLMKQNGYRVVRVSFIHPEQSAHWNPINYCKTTQQIQQLSSAIVYSHGIINVRDPFWDITSIQLINALTAYVNESFRDGDNRKNFHTILKLLRKSRREKEGDNDTELCKLMAELKRLNPNSWAYKQFENVNQSPNKTFATIIECATGELGLYDTEELAKMMAYDEIDFKTIGQKKTAVFVEVSDTDRSMDALINIFLTQCLNQLCTYADEECEGFELPVPVRFILDDFATNCHINDFDKMISNIRSRKISAMLIIQSLAQLEASYGENANTIIDNCDTQVFMGTNSPQTAYQIGLRCNKSVDTILHMPLHTCWIFRRGEQPVYGNVMSLDDYFDMKGITEEMLYPAITVDNELSEVE